MAAWVSPFVPALTLWRSTARRTWGVEPVKCLCLKEIELAVSWCLPTMVYIIPDIKMCFWLFLSTFLWKAKLEEAIVKGWWNLTRHNCDGTRNPSKSDHSRPVPFDHFRWCIFHNFLNFPKWFSKRNGSSFQILILARDVSGWRCNLCLMVQLLRMSLRFPEATWCIFPSNVWRKSTSDDLTKLQNMGGVKSWKCHPSQWPPSLRIGNFWNLKLIVFNSTIFSNKELVPQKVPQKSMNLKVIQFLLAGAHPLRANAVEHLGIAVSETPGHAQNCGRQKASQNILYSCSCSDRCFLIVF